jgi:hypothetical protein
MKIKRRTRDGEDERRCLSENRRHENVMRLLGEYDGFPAGRLFSGDAHVNYVGIDRHRQYTLRGC